jgi:myo-inositol-1(or 4)-monophosphatase
MNLLDLAIKAAKEAGALLCNPQETIQIAHKGSIDLVTQYDRRSEEHICKVLEPSGISILAEEQGLIQRSDSDARWIIDPLDGTTNFSHHFPHYCVSIALEEAGELSLGVIYDPNRKELYTAQKGKGAFLNGKQCKVSSCSSLTSALLLTGFAYDRQERPEFYLHYFEHFLKNSRGLRRCGSAALDLAFIASGRGDGFWEFGLNAWDVAAGILLVQEAGGFVGGLYENQRPLDGNLIACSEGLSPEMISVFQKLHQTLPF